MTDRPDPAVVLAIDIGGSHVKIRTSDHDDVRRAISGPEMDAQGMVDAVRALADGVRYDRVAMGYPSPVIHGRILSEPYNLAPGWVGFDFASAFGRPVKIVNDALMQAVGSYRGGRMLFLGLGTGLGAAMIVENVAQPMEIAHLPYCKGRSFEAYLGKAGLKKRGANTWRKHVFKAVDQLRTALEPDDVVIGGGNVDRLDIWPEGCRRGDNGHAFEGGFRLWTDPTLVI